MINLFELSSLLCMTLKILAVMFLGDDESILLAIPQTSQIQRWLGLKQHGLISAFVSCHAV